MTLEEQITKMTTAIKQAIKMSVREAFSFVTCEAYGNAFPEKSSLESFE
jgi:hypothetical protein